MLLFCESYADVFLQHSKSSYHNTSMQQTDIRNAPFKTRYELKAYRPRLFLNTHV